MIGDFILIFTLAVIWLSSGLLAFFLKTVFLDSPNSFTKFIINSFIILGGLVSLIGVLVVLLFKLLKVIFKK